MPASIRHVVIVALSLCCVLAWQAARATGTSSGTIIRNVATLQFVEAGTTFQVSSTASTFRVDEVLEVVNQSLDAGNVVVASPDVRRVLTFKLTNTGNGSQRYALAANVNVGGDQFDPTLYKVFLDSNGNGLFDAADQEYVAGLNDPLLPPDRPLTIFVVDDIPAGRTNDDVGLVKLTAQAVVGTGPAGTVFSGRGAGGSDLVVGTSRGIAVAQNGYVVAQVQPVLTKSQTVVNPFGGSIPLPGSVVTYALRLELNGRGTTLRSLISDSIPTNATYVANSLRLDGSSLTDQSDTDAGRFNGTGIEVDLGTLSAPIARVVTFQVRLN